MRHEDALKRLDDYLDGELPAAQARELERHLRGCEACRQEVAELRRLLAAAADLPRELPPPDGLWPQIAGRLAGPGVDQAARREQVHRWRRPLPRSWRPALALAAVLALVLLSTAILRLAGPPAGGEPRGPAGLSVPAVLALECGLAATDRAAEVRQASPPPGVQALIEQDLAIIDRAIAELDAAWSADPDNTHLTRMLVAAHRARVSLLAQETDLALRS